MTEPWTPGVIPQRGTNDPADYFNVRDAQAHLLLVRIQDEVLKFSTKDCPDGMKLLMRGPNKGMSVPNNVVRATIADLNLPNPDGSGLGKIYEEAVIFAGTLVKDFKKAVGSTLLLVWKQQDPTDKSSPYSYTLMNENPQAVQAARDFLDRHPEFMTIPAPEPYQLPEPRQIQQAPQQQGYPQAQYPPPYPPQGYPPQSQPQQWQQQPGTQPYPPAQPGYGPPPPQYPPQQPPAYPPAQPQWQPQGPPVTPPWEQPQAPQGNGSFLSRAQAQPDYYVQHEPNRPVNHHGQPQSENPPY